MPRIYGYKRPEGNLVGLRWLRERIRWWMLDPSTKELVRETDRINEDTLRMIAEHYERYPREER
jgi:hypothetical protein